MADHSLNIIVIIFNNGTLGLVKQQQEMFYNNNLMASQFISKPDFAGIAGNFGIANSNIENLEELKIIIENRKCLEPMILNIPIEADINVLPIVPPGASNIQMIGGKKRA